MKRTTTEQIIVNVNAVNDTCNGANHLTLSQEYKLNMIGVTHISVRFLNEELNFHEMQMKEDDKKYLTYVLLRT